MKKSVMSAGGSFEISGASRWLAAFAGDGARPKRGTSTPRAPPSRASAITAEFRLPRTAGMAASFLPQGSIGGPDSLEAPKRFGYGLMRGPGGRSRARPGAGGG